MAVAGVGLLFVGVGIAMVIVGYGQRVKWLGWAKWLAWGLLMLGVLYALIGAALVL
jgi:hypothetical protein